MSLSSAIGSAIGGLNASQAGLDIVSRNIANANTPGYTSKTLQVQNVIAGGVGIGVQVLAATRNVDTFLQQQLNSESATTQQLNVYSNFLGQLVQTFGTPDSNSSVAASVTALETNMQAVATTPDDSAARQTLLNSASNLASQLNSMSSQIQGLRSQAESNIATAVGQANTALQSIAKLNSQIAQGSAAGQSVADLQDIRDTAVATLSQLMGVKTLTHSDGTIAVFTTGGQLLLDKSPVTLSFDQHTNMDASSSYSTDPSQRTVGTITLQNGNSAIDLIASGAIRSGSIAGYVAMRDQVLPQAQSQLDELAAKLALSLSTDTVQGTAASASSGTGTGFNVDASSFVAGNTTGATGTSINFTYTDGAGTHNVSVVPVSDPSLLPLPNSASGSGNSTLGVYVDPNATASAQMASIASAIQTTYPGLAVSNPSGNTLQILDDGTGTARVNSATATVVENASTMNNGVGTGLSLFVDGSGQKTFTGALGNPPQTLGFAARIQVNSLVQADSTNLVVYQTNPQTAIGDDTRPNDLLNRLTDSTRTYSATTGIGSAGTPYAGSIDAFARQIVSYQSTQAGNASSNYTTQKVVSDSLQSTMDSATGVNIDNEMSNLIVLQNAYSANARVIDTVKNLFDVLLSIGR
ncbi:MAG: flagellar hook-associated protein FlgK [Parvibaculum sp.]|uniref:flagellar hook-associated protein FlgK n=1 Tax=Parvibaculum sp. TaxID=2024848 RepID=UPI00284FE25D|nr:flagellar hook-associated protein FlgK [Parvibaculum sp.]MDR3500558.1 flagellar hook-associated protein FlgK [Parvibaculum sp.]